MAVGGRQVRGAPPVYKRRDARRRSVRAATRPPHTMTLGTIMLSALAVLALSAAAVAYPVKVGNNVDNNRLYYGTCHRNNGSFLQQSQDHYNPSIVALQQQ